MTDTLEVSAPRQTSGSWAVTMPVVGSHDDETHRSTAMTYYYESSAGHLWYIGQPDAAGEAITGRTAGDGARRKPRRFFGEDAAAQRRLRGA
jgi:hypothetical protein